MVFLLGREVNRNCDHADESIETDGNDTGNQIASGKVLFDRIGTDPEHDEQNCLEQENTYASCHI